VPGQGHDPERRLEGAGRTLVVAVARSPARAIDTSGGIPTVQEGWPADENATAIDSYGLGATCRGRHARGRCDGEPGGDRLRERARPARVHVRVPVPVLLRPVLAVPVLLDDDHGLDVDDLVDHDDD